MESKMKFNVKHFSLIAFCFVACLTLCLFAVFLSPEEESASALTSSYGFAGDSYNSGSFRCDSLDNLVTYTPSILSVPYSFGINYINGDNTNSSPYIGTDDVLGDVVCMKHDGSGDCGLYFDFAVSRYLPDLNGEEVALSQFSVSVRCAYYTLGGSAVSADRIYYGSYDGITWTQISSASFSYPTRNSTTQHFSAQTFSRSNNDYNYFRCLWSAPTSSYVAFVYCICYQYNFAPVLTYDSYLDGHTPDLDPVASLPYDFWWYGFTQPNLLADNGYFDYKPVDVSLLPDVSPLSDVPMNTWYCTSFNDSNKIFYPILENQNTLFVSLEYNESATVYYRFPANGLIDGTFSYWVRGYSSYNSDVCPVTLSAQYFGNGHVTEVLSTNSWLSDKRFSWVSLDLDQTVDSTPDVARSSTYILLSITFTNHFADQVLKLPLGAAKLERCRYFSGFVERSPSYSIESDLVNANLITNYNFKDPILLDDGDNPLGYWVLYDNGISVVVNNDPLDYGTEFFSAFHYSVGTTFADFHPGYSTYTFALSYSTHADTAYVSIRGATSNTFLGGCVLPKTSNSSDGFNVVDFNIRITDREEPIFIEVYCSSGTLALYFCKLEVNDKFTGFIFGQGDLANYYTRGYNTGYTEGFQSGLDSIVTSAFVVDFSSSDDSYRISVGYEELFGITRADLTDLNAVMSSFFYTSVNSDFVVQGFKLLYDVDGIPHGFTLYGSRFTFFDLDHHPIYGRGDNYYIELTFGPDYAYCWMDDPDLPYPYDATLYPDIKKFNITLYRGVAVAVTAYSEMARDEGYKSGYNRGFSDGKDNGIAIGYQDGLSLSSVASWRSFLFAFVDTPVQVLMGLFDFEFFGFNFFNLIKVFVSISIVLLLARLLLKGKVSA